MVGPLPSVPAPPSAVGPVFPPDPGATLRSPSPAPVAWVDARVHREERSTGLFDFASSTILRSSANLGTSKVDPPPGGGGHELVSHSSSSSYRLMMETNACRRVAVS